jgi:hypothetical protein
MTAIVTAAEITAHLESMGAVELRKLGATMKIKGASKGKKADLVAAISKIRIAEMEEAAKKAKPAAAPKRGICTDCGRKEDFRGSELCGPCREYAEDENMHSDEGHEVVDGKPVGENAETCRVCRPELDTRKARREGRSRAGMVIVAKGSEVHKSLLFKRDAEAKGWTVEISKETYELAADATGEGTRHYADATRGNDSIQLAWDGRAYDYPNSSAKINGKDRKVRNLKEALRIL